MHRKILIIGVGGIGSNLVPLLCKVGQYDITIADPDTVEEKNISSQNFNEQNIGNYKCASMIENLEKISKHDRMCIKKYTHFPVLVENQIDDFDLIIICADNLDVRRLVYRRGFQDDCSAKWLDLRAQGRNGALISYLTDPKLCDTFLSGPEGSFSCQGETDVTNTANIHFTHVAIAGIGAQWVQRWFNGEEVKDKMVINI